jgi:hypothetical protein
MNILPRNRTKPELPETGMQHIHSIGQFREIFLPVKSDTRLAAALCQDVADFLLSGIFWRKLI